MEEKKKILLSKTLIEEWHPTKNYDISLFKITPGSKKKVWWLCPKGHEYSSRVSHRTNGSGCPYCSGLKVLRENSLSIIFPKIAITWNNEKNKLTPYEVSPHSGKKAWWKCKKGHEWQARIADRTGGQDCPYCSGKRVTDVNRFSVNHPELIKEWHPVKNKNITPRDIHVTSGKKYWWICEKSHEYQATAAHRHEGKGCPYCAGRKLSKDNTLLARYPEVAKEWHPTKNKNISPDKIIARSPKKAWWLCPNGHEYQSSLANRTNQKGCPYCAGRKVDQTNSLRTIFSDIAKEWHPNKNGSLTPDDVVAYANKYAWWRCNHGHEWKAIISSRSSGTGCPFCSPQTSKNELRLLSELELLIPELIHRYKSDKKEIDLFIKDKQIGIEYDGEYWHRKKEKSDRSKNKFFHEKGITVIRIREKGLPKLGEYDIIYYPKSTMKSSIDSLLLLLQDFGITNENIVQYLKQDSYINDSGYNKRINNMYVAASKSLAQNSERLSKEWHPTKNGELTPEKVTQNSGRLVWWKCENGHEWKESISYRNRDKGCPYCRKIRPSDEYNLSAVFPKLAQEWSNKNLKKPSEFLPKSNIKVWWQCKEGHEWQAAISKRANGRGCPVCFENRRSRGT